MCFNIIWALTQKTLTLLLANTKGPDQTTQMPSLNSTFVIRYMKLKVTLNSPNVFGGLTHNKIPGYAPVVFLQECKGFL